MDITLQDVANVVTLILPGYFATKIYSVVYARSDKELSRTILESVVFSLPIVATYDYFWRQITGDDDIVATSVNYVIPLLLVSIAIGWSFALARRWKPINRLARRLWLPSPDGDFIRQQFHKLKPGESVTVTLQNGEVFSGTPQGGSTFKSGEPQLYYFNNIAWFDKKKGRWDDREGSVIIEISEARYLETSKSLPRD